MEKLEETSNKNEPSLRARTPPLSHSDRSFKRICCVLCSCNKWSESCILWFHSYFSFVICISKLMMNCSPSDLDFDLRFGDYLLVKFQLSCVSEIGNCSSVRSVPVGQWGNMSGGELWTSSRVTHEHVLTRCCSINIQGVGLWYQTWTKMWINKLKACSV